jgi:hypothetical protein
VDFGNPSSVNTSEYVPWALADDENIYYKDEIDSSIMEAYMLFYERDNSI